VDALVPRINLREIGWIQLESEQRQNLIYAFSQREAAFRRLDKWELIEFAQEAIRPSEPTYEPSIVDPVLRRKVADFSTRWHAGSRLYHFGTEENAIRIEWSQGPQAVKAAMEKWFQQHKRGLARLKREGKLPGAEYGSHMYHLRDETGAKNPRRKYMSALRGLGAMRLLGSHTLREAIEITKGSLYSSDPRSRSAWNKGITQARQTFQELFYPQYEYWLRIRRLHGLPEIEEPISYQRLLLRRQNK
jgi:hypothetical protein